MQKPEQSIIIRPSGGWFPISLRELWESREVLYFLVWRDIKVRYKQTVLGAAWAILQPFFTMIAFSVFFGHLAKIPSDGIPYPIFAFCALVPWQLFTNALSLSSNSLVSNSDLITKIYFPRVYIPVSAVIGGLVDFSIAFVVLLGMMLYYGILPSLAILTLPLLILLTVMTAISVGLWLSAINVQYRDIRYTLPFLTQFWLIATPIAYPSTLVPEKWRGFLGLNPMAGVVEGFRWALLGKTSSIGPIIIISVMIVIVLLLGGFIYFSKKESTFADII
jgi:lipopolysaccharide transport system permease protein